MKYFAYGSNMNIKRMEARGITFSNRLKACLFGYNLKFNKTSTQLTGQGYANIVREDSGLVEGILYEITKQGLENLDKYEQYPFEYDRRLFSVRLTDGIDHMAHVYIAQAHKTADTLKPTINYLSHLLRAQDLLSGDYMLKLSAQKTID